MEMLYEYITHLADYAEKEALLEPCDRTYAINGLLAIFGENEYAEPLEKRTPPPHRGDSFRSLRYCLRKGDSRRKRRCLPRPL